MNYTISVPEIHCMGCVNLIKMTLEDNDFENVSADLDTKTASFSSTATVESLQPRLAAIFKQELPGYSVSDLSIKQ